MANEEMATVAPPEGAESGTEPNTLRPESGLVVDALAALPPGTILDERAAARMFHCSTATIKRCVQRGELPVPIRMLGRPCWTTGRIIEHVTKRLLDAQREAEREAQRLSRFSP
jgi:hypothetical protein